MPIDEGRTGTPALTTDGRSRVQVAGLFLGLAALIAIAASPTWQTFSDHAIRTLGLEVSPVAAAELARGCQTTLAVLSIMVIWWVTEAVPLPITALLPGLLLPMLHVTGAQNGELLAFDANESFASFANPVIYLFLAGFLLAGAMRKTGLDRRITLGMLCAPGMMRGPAACLFAVMLITAFLSMWISNTATVAMMLPIVLRILDELGEAPGRSRLGTAMLLGVAWSASAGGIGTLIGTPPNGIVKGILEKQSIIDLNFVSWMKIGMPVAIGTLVAAWLLLVVMFRPKARDMSASLAAIRDARQRLGAVTVDEKATLGAFALVVTLWVTHPWWQSILPASLYARLERFDIDEIGLLCAALLFIVPVSRRNWRAVLTWKDTKYVDWGTLILFGGGIALSNAMFKTGLTEWMAVKFVSLMGTPAPWAALLLVVLLVDFMTEVTSNTAVTTMMTPVLVSLAPQLGLSPVTLCVAAAMASSLAFMLPVATPPNALVYGCGYFSVGQMARAGFLMNLLGCCVMILGLYLVTSGVFGALSMP